MILYGWTKAVLLMELDFLDAKLMVKIIGFPNGPSFRYGNFFIPRVEKTSKNQPKGRKAFLPRAVGPRNVSFSFPWSNFNVFSTQGMKKFPYLKPTAHSEIVCLQELTKQHFYFMLQLNEFFQKKNSVRIKKSSNFNFLSMWKLGFRMRGHAEIRFLFISATTI